MRWPKPRITIHPGFPKCATSAIQQAFVLENHRLARALKVNFISAGFTRNNGHPDVTRIMDDPDGFMDDLQRAIFLRRNYFLSSEALLSIDLELFCQRFEVERWAVTTRLPIAQAISNYRYSGWISGCFEDWAKRSENNFDTIALRQTNKIAKLKELPGDMVVVPLEAASKAGAVSLFCERVFGARPGLARELHVDTGEQVNPSINFALADALGRKIKQRGLVKIEPQLRRALVRAAKNFVLSDEFAGLNPAGVQECVQPFQIEARDKYQALLELSDLGIDTAYVLENAGSNLSRLLNGPIANADQQTRLDCYADDILDTGIANGSAHQD